MNVKSVLSTLLNILLGIMGFIVSLVTKPIIYLWEVHMNTKFGFWKYVITAYVALFVLAGVLWFFPTTIGGVAWNWGIEIILLLAIYSMPPWSWETVGPTQLGARIFFGKILGQVGPGPHYVPAILVTLKTETGVVIQDEIPCDPEHIFRGDGKVPEKMFPPIRIPFGSPSEESGISKDDPYNARMVAEVVPVISWRIEDYPLFLSTIGSVEEARRQMEDESVSMLTEAFAKITPAAALKQLEKYSEDLKIAIDKKVKGWGIDVQGARIKAINFSHSLNTAILGVSEATVKAKSAIIDAEATKQTLTLEGQGASAATKAKLDAETDGRKRMAFELGVPGSAILAAETARAVTSNPGQKTVIMGADGFNQLAKVGVALGETFADAITEKKGV